MAPKGAKQPENAIDKLEQRTQRRIGIESNEYEAFGRYHEQDASPLFSVLPRELRDLIWSFATAPFEDQDHKFPENAYYCRPGHRARLRTDFNLLLTCRRVWLEANALPMLQAEHSFYYHREAPDARKPAWTAALTEQNRQNFGHLHLYAQMFAIEGLSVRPGHLRSYFLKTQQVAGDFQPRVFHVTLRHTDWWFWESEEPLRLADSWVDSLLNSPDLRSTHVLKLEMETLDYKVHQLRPIIDRLKRIESTPFQTHDIDGKLAESHFVLDENEEVYAWDGPADINNGNYQPYEGKTRLKYHVVTLTWRLRFPDIARAFVPELRRAPRIPASGRPYDENDYGLFNEHVITEENIADPFAEGPGNPYVAHGDGMSGRAKRRLRSQKGMNPKHAEDLIRHIDMGKLQEGIEYNMCLQAEMVEMPRRTHFKQGITETAAMECQTKWEAEKSLLKFVGTLPNPVEHRLERRRLRRGTYPRR